MKNKFISMKINKFFITYLGIMSYLLIWKTFVIYTEKLFVLKVTKIILFPIDKISVWDKYMDM